MKLIYAVGGLAALIGVGALLLRKRTDAQEPGETAAEGEGLPVTPDPVPDPVPEIVLPPAVEIKTGQTGRFLETVKKSIMRFSGDVDRDSDTFRKLRSQLSDVAADTKRSLKNARKSIPAKFAFQEQRLALKAAETAVIDEKNAAVTALEQIMKAAISGKRIALVGA